MVVFIFCFLVIVLWNCFEIGLNSSKVQFLLFVNVLESMGYFESFIFLLWVHCFFSSLGFWFRAFLFALFLYAKPLFWFVNNLDITIVFWICVHYIYLFICVFVFLKSSKILQFVICAHCFLVYMVFMFLYLCFYEKFKDFVICNLCAFFMCI
jgi:hypothetical protein